MNPQHALRTIFLVTLFFLAALSVTAQFTPSLTWTKSTIDSTGGGASGQASIAAFDQNNIFVVHYDAATKGVRLSVSSDGGATWNFHTTIAPNARQGSIVAASNTLFVTYFDDSTKSLMFARSTDTGKTWTPKIIETFTHFITGISIGVADTNHIFVVYNPLTTPDALKIAISSDSGQTWTKKTIESAGYFNAVSLFALDANHLFLAYTYSGTVDRVLRFAQSNDGGQTWTAKTIDPQEGMGYDSSIKASDQNHIFIAYSHSNPGEYLKFARSIDGGQTWTKNTIDNDGRTGISPSLAAIDAQNLFIAYHITSPDYNLLFTTSSDSGQTWSKEVIDSDGNVGDYLALTALDTQHVFISYHDNTDWQTTSVHPLKFIKGTPATTTTTNSQTTMTPFVPQLLITAANKCGATLKNAQENALLPHAVCQPFGEWLLTSDDNDTVEKTNPFGTTGVPQKYLQCGDQNFHTTGCCSTTKCWNGTICINDGDFLSSSTQGFICNNGNWQPRTKKRTFARDLSGFCPRDEQCLVTPVGSQGYNDQPDKFFTASDTQSQPRCITNKQYLTDEYCDSGNWTTRTKLIAVQLLSLADTSGITNYDLFCDKYTNVLNTVTYAYGPGQSAVENYLKETCVKSGKIMPCINNICVLKTSRGVAALGASLNSPIDGSLSFLRALNLTEHDCDNTLSGIGFTQCNPTQPITGQVWYNPQLESIIYFPPQLQTSLTDKYTQPNLKTILNYVNTKSVKEIPTLNFGFFNRTQNFNTILYSKKDGRAIFAFLENAAREENLPSRYYLGIKYSNFSLGVDPCQLFKSTLTNPICEKQIAPYDFVLIAKDNPAPQWRDLTAKLRLVAGPPVQISTDVGTTALPTSTTQQNPCD